MKKFWRNNTLIKWIFFGCVTLLIPILCAGINYLINRELLANRTSQVSRFSLENIQYNIDSRLESASALARLFLSDDLFSAYSLNVEDDILFLERVRKCCQNLKISRKANQEMEVVVYLPEKDYFINSDTANSLTNVYGSLASSNKIDMTEEEWRKRLDWKQDNGFTISASLSYSFYGQNSFVYVTPLLYSSEQNPGWMFVVTPADYVEEMSNSSLNEDNTILVAGKSGEVLRQYGRRLELEGEEIPWENLDTEETIQISGESYIVFAADSTAAEWRYLVLVPKNTYLREARWNRNINILVVLLGALLGTLVVIFLQRKNYRPLKKMIEILPEGETEPNQDEFERVEKNLIKLYRENSQMKHSIQNRRDYDREISLLGYIKGSGSLFIKLSPEEMFGESGTGQSFALVTIQYDMDEAAPDLNINSELLLFVIHNIASEILQEDYELIRTVDNEVIVYLLLLNSGEKKRCYMERGNSRFEWINEFFQKRLQMELSVTLGRPFEGWAHLESAYAELQEFNEQRYFTKPTGVMMADSIRKIDFSSPNRLKYYFKQFEETAVKADFKEAVERNHALFYELHDSGCSFQTMNYYVLAIANDILMAVKNMVFDTDVGETRLEEVLDRLRRANTPEELQEAFYGFLKQICSAVDEDAEDFSGISDRIKEYVKENFANPDMNISSIADAMGITPRYMSKVFREQTGGALLNYINDERIVHAKWLLRNTSGTVEEIAEETGFANVRTFRRNFLKAAGVTAAQFRSE